MTTDPTTIRHLADDLQAIGICIATGDPLMLRAAQRGIEEVGQLLAFVPGDHPLHAELADLQRRYDQAVTPPEQASGPRVEP